MIRYVPARYLLTAALIATGLPSCTAADSSAAAGDPGDAVAWDASRHYLSQDSAAYATPEAVQLADELLWYQQRNGGWPLFSSRLRTVTADSAALRAQKDRTDAWIIATARKLRFLTRVHRETGIERFEAPIERGLDYLVSTQYANGGLPKIFPDTSYRDGRDSSHNPRGRVPLISLNDGAMPMAMSVLLDVAQDHPDFAFVDAERRERVRRSVEKGTEAFLRLQIVANGERTGWAQQYDEVTMEPRWGRKFEPRAIAARETIDVLRYLTSIEDPSPEVIEAIQSAVAWLDRVKLLGVRVETAPEPTPVQNWDRTVTFTDRHERRLVDDAAAPPLWAHFYEIGTNRPVFASEDDTIRYALADISFERRSGYQWYGTWVQGFLDDEYAAWLRRTGQPSAVAGGADAPQ